MKIVGLVLLVAGLSRIVMAGWISAVPEIDGASGMNALALLSGVLLIIKSRRK